MNDQRTPAVWASRLRQQRGMSTQEHDALAALLDVVVPIWDALPPCETCGGVGFLSPYPSNDGDPCPNPDCDGGRLRPERFIARLLGLLETVRTEMPTLHANWLLRQAGKS